MMPDGSSTLQAALEVATAKIATTEVAPFQAKATVHRSAEPLKGIVTSPNGFLSDKDSGDMFYVIRLA